MDMELCSMEDDPNAEANELPASSGYKRIDSNVGEASFFSEQTNITVLPPELLLEMFSYLSAHDLCTAAQVCKSWQEIAYYKCLWQNIEVTIYLKEDNSAFFAALASRGIKKLNVRSMEKSFPEITTVVPNLELLNISDCFSFADAATISTIFSNHAPNLVELNLTYCNKVTEDSISQITFYCKNIKILYLDFCINITDTCLMLIAWGFRDLKLLSIRACTAITDIGIKYVVGPRFHSSSGGGRCLERLVLRECTKISNAALHYFSEGFMEQLKTLNISYCTKITDEGLKDLTKINTLSEIEIKGCPQITNTGIEYNLIKRGFKQKSIRHFIL